MNSDRRWVCAQLGAREHYAIPRALNIGNHLNSLITDLWAGFKLRGIAKCLPSRQVQSIAAKYSPDIPDKNVIALTSFFIESEVRRRLFYGGYVNTRARYQWYCEQGRYFALDVVRTIKMMKLNLREMTFVGYDTCSLEVMQYLKAEGALCILDQVDPCRVEMVVVAEEQERWKGWEANTFEISDEFCERHYEEWKVADAIIVNSTFSKNALLSQGAKSEKMYVVPLSYEFEQKRVLTLNTRSNKDILPGQFTKVAPLRVLFLGQVNLRKGVQYLLQAAKHLENEPVQIDIVGPIQLTDLALTFAPDNVRFWGRAGRDEVGAWFGKADVFVLPTISDGFGITQIEAMAHALPVIATVNCGNVVTNGVDGYVIPPRNSSALASAIREYVYDKTRLLEHSAAACRTSKRFTLNALLDQLLAVEQMCLQSNEVR